MKMNKIISLLLAVLMLASAFTVLVGAAGEEGRKYEYRTNSTTSLLAKLTGTVDGEEYAYKTGQYALGENMMFDIKTPDQKLDLMDYRYGTEDYELYVDAYSGEVAVKNKVTGEMLFTNPYSLAGSTASDSTKEELLSQLIVSYTSLADGMPGTYASYTWAAKRHQILVKNIKGGIRVEYSIGREENKTLAPRQISEQSFYKKIWTPLLEYFGADPVKYSDPFKMYDSKSSTSVAFKDEYGYDAYFEIAKFIFGYYMFKDPNDPKSYVTQAGKDKMLETYPATEKFPIWVLDTSLLENELKKVEGFVKTYCPEYSFEDMEEDHLEAGYEGQNESFPLFKMALEYTLDKDGLVVRLPANGIRFDETLYRLESVEILPYMGAGNKTNDGYIFFPDGSGALFEFDDIAMKGVPQTVKGKIYGSDYAYHEITGKMEETLRYPVFGLVETETTENGDKKDRGYVAIVEEGDSLMELTMYHPGQLSEYNTVRMTVYPRPTDTFNMADAISVAGNSEWTVVSDRKYTGSYKIRYVMLTDDKVAAKKEISDYFDTTYVGMAKAYRSYLEEKGILTRLTAEDVTDHIPLYIETFGALLTTEKILSIPVDVMTPLTSFSDIKTMYEAFEAEGVKNINFILTGYTKGGLEAEQVPYKLKWENAVEKDMDFEELLEDARASGYGVYPDFDFAFASENKAFDGFTLKKHAAKTIDNRYTSKREYSATKHTYVSYFEMAISPAYFSHFYEKFIPKYNKYNPMGISISTLGSYLNSDFDEDEPYNRADGQEFTEKAFEYIKNNFKDADVLTSGGNAYTWKYVDHITDVALDSSRYTVASAAVPFLGMVLHGYVEIAGTPINMEGNLEYAFLKALESGAALNFVLSYRNTDNLKDNPATSQYYSVRYDIWFNDVVSMYHELNTLLKGVQTSVIVNHEFLDGVRVPDADELEADALAALEETLRYEEALKEAIEEIERQSLLDARLAVVFGTKTIKNAIDATAEGTLFAKKAQLDPIVELMATRIEEAKAAEDAKEKDSKLKEAISLLSVIYTLVTEMKDEIVALNDQYNEAVAGMQLLKDKKAFSAAVLADLEAQFDAALTNAMTQINTMNGVVDAIAAKAYNDIKASFTEDETKTVKEFTYTAPVKTPAPAPTLPKAPSTNSTKYQSDANMIVHVTYENGTEFLINFNDYRVIVKLDRDGDGLKESSYTLDTYGYIVLKSAS